MAPISSSKPALCNISSAKQFPQPLSAIPASRKRSSSSPQFSASLLSAYSVTPNKSYSSFETSAANKKSDNCASQSQSRPQSYIQVTEVTNSSFDGVAANAAYTTMDQYVRVKFRKGRFTVSSWEHRGKIAVSQIDLPQFDSPPIALGSGDHAG
ncbi:hypothetical protein HK098_005263 [Nowakowskiella sp. JEL0407]|nr:hypothetical protein HK098_005263 [Nowakowskiella sp. JEL0407]